MVSANPKHRYITINLHHSILLCDCFLSRIFRIRRLPFVIFLLRRFHGAHKSGSGDGMSAMGTAIQVTVAAT